MGVQTQLASCTEDTVSGFFVIYRLTGLIPSTLWLCHGVRSWTGFVAIFVKKIFRQNFAKKIVCGLCLRHGIRSLFNAQLSFVELEVILWGVKNVGSQEVQQKTL